MNSNVNEWNVSIVSNVNAMRAVTCSIVVGGAVAVVAATIDAVAVVDNCIANVANVFILWLPVNTIYKTIETAQRDTISSSCMHNSHS